jgi:hypothetical protein
MRRVLPASAFPLAALLPVTLPTVEPAVAGYALASLVAVAWDVVYANRIAQLRRAPRVLAALSGVCGLAVPAAYAVYLAGSSLYGGRAVNALSWVWPLAALLVVAQALYAAGRRFVTPLVGVPIVLFDLLAAAVTVTRYLVGRGVEPPAALLALSAAQAAVLATVLGRAALVSPVAVLVPLLVPAYPARFRLTRAGRALLALGAAFVTGVTLLELPRGVGAVASYAAFAEDRLSERPGGNFAVGVSALTHLAGPPPALTVRTDVPLVDSLEADAVAVRLRPAAGTLGALDSLDAVLEPARRDSTRLIVWLGYAAGDAAERRRDPAAFDARRLALVERVARALRPDVLLPAGAPYGESAALVGRLSVEEWAGYLTAAAARAKRVNRRIDVGVAAGDYSPADSALYRWAAAPGSPLDAVGFTVSPSVAGGTGVDARLRAADRWMRASGASGAGEGGAPGAPAAAKAHWVWDVHAFPVAHGVASQANTVWHTLAWATAHPAVGGCGGERARGLRGAHRAARPHRPAAARGGGAAPGAARAERGGGAVTGGPLPLGVGRQTA